MRRIFLTCWFACAPLMAAAQSSYDNSPMVVIGGDTTAAKPAISAPAAPNPTAPADAPAPTATTPPPTAAQAAATPNATPAKPILPVTPPLPANFPAWAVSQAGQNTAGNSNPQPAAPVSPPNPVGAINGAAPASPAMPGAPLAPASPADKLWPRDTVPIFVKSCIGFHVELAPACTCVITTLMGSMPHDEFLRESAAGTIESDPRLLNARSQCAATPDRK